MSDLRDHSRPCGHGYTRHHVHPVKAADGKWLRDDVCPGGAPVVIDYEAAKHLRRITPNEQLLTEDIVNAALGIVEVDDA